VTDVVIHNFQKPRGLSQQVKHLALYAMPEETAILFADCPALCDYFFSSISAAFSFLLCFFFFSFFLSFYFSILSAPFLFITPLFLQQCHFFCFHSHI
jgi:hypothetical protein